MHEPKPKPTPKGKEKEDEPAVKRLLITQIVLHPEAPSK